MDTGRDLGARLLVQAVLSLQSESPISRSGSDFHAFSFTHFAVVACTIIGIALILMIGLRRRSLDNRRTFDIALGWTGIAIWILANGYGLLPGVFRWDSHLPLHLCDWCALIGPLVVLLERPPRWMRTFLYFAGIGLCTHAYITPTLEQGPADPQFWSFWLGHFVILASALYDVVVRRYRPTWRDFAIAVVLSLGYLAIVMTANALGGWDYAFVGKAAREGTIVVILGPWPWRIGVMILGTVALYAIMTMPWVMTQRQAQED